MPSNKSDTYSSVDEDIELEDVEPGNATTSPQVVEVGGTGPTTPQQILIQIETAAGGRKRLLLFIGLALLILVLLLAAILFFVLFTTDAASGETTTGATTDETTPQETTPQETTPEETTEEPTEPIPPKRKKSKNIILMISDGMGPAHHTFYRLMKGVKRTELDKHFVANVMTASASSSIPDSAATATAYSAGVKTINGAVGVLKETVSHDQDEPDNEDENTKKRSLAWRYKNIINNRNNNNNNNNNNDNNNDNDNENDNVKNNKRKNQNKKRQPTMFDHHEDRYTAVGTVFEAAKNKGLVTGLIVTSRLTHATPAAFASHVTWRDYEYEIARQYAEEQNVDILLGGGQKYWQNRTSSIETMNFPPDDLLHELRKKYSITLNKKDFRKSKNQKLPFLGIFHPSHMDYDIDRLNNETINEQQPSLAEMAEVAFKLAKKSKQGFLLMVEGSRIDMAAHKHDPAALYRAIDMYEETWAEAMKLVDENPEDTMLLSVSDHATGGLSVGARYHNDTYPEYEWFPELVRNAKASTEFIYARMSEGENIKQLIKTYYGFEASVDEVEYINGAVGATDEYRVVPERIGEVLSYRAGLGWTTTGHTGSDVHLYAYGNYPADELTGVIDNTLIHRVIVDELGLDVANVTRSLRNMEFAPPPDQAIRLTKRNQIYGTHN